MRDPKRIEPLLDTIRKFMHCYPDLRLSQIIFIANKNQDPFYMEDSTLKHRLDEMLKNDQNNG